MGPLGCPYPDFCPPVFLSISYSSLFSVNLLYLHLYSTLCYEMADELEDLWQWIILFLFLFHLLCNYIECMGYYDSKGVHKIIQVDKYK